jgi:hypothetical protein
MRGDLHRICALVGERLCSLRHNMDLGQGEGCRVRSTIVRSRCVWEAGADCQIGLRKVRALRSVALTPLTTYYQIRKALLKWHKREAARLSISKIVASHCISLRETLISFTTS